MTSTARVLHSLDEIDSAAWNRCANPGGTVAHDPFARHEFLQALEESGSTTAQTGWQPFHLALETDGNLEGVMPLYVKSHSRGEYVFDHAWADAWYRSGRDYYPKLQSSIPFTPATGRRLLAQDADPDIERTLLGAAVQLTDQIEVSSLHLTFLPEAQWQAAGELGLLQRIDQQFHWHNAGYHRFDDFLADLSSKKRKNLRRERRDALANDIEIEWLTGNDLEERHWDAFYHFYLDTGGRKWGSPYLTRAFFSLISERMAEDILLILCRRDGRYVAGALNFIGGDTLYGRNWGCIEHHPFLHFETCYYQAIDFAIERRLKRVEAGAQGSHKVARGYLPQATYSAHWVCDPQLREAVRDYLVDERRYVAQDIDHVEQHTPFRSDVNLDDIRSVDLKAPLRN